MGRRQALAGLLEVVLTSIIVAIMIAATCGCERGVEPTFAGSWRWDHTPIEVGGSDVDEWEDELHAAAKAWNDAAGCEIFRVTESVDVLVIVAGEPPPNPRARGWTEVYAVGNRITRAQIGLWEVAESGQAYRVLAHELGRTLALSGGYWPEPEPSVMHRLIAERETLPVLVTHADGAAVRGRYCSP